MKNWKDSISLEDLTFELSEKLNQNIVKALINSQVDFRVAEVKEKNIGEACQILLEVDHHDLKEIFLQEWEKIKEEVIKKIQYDKSTHKYVLV